MADQDDKNNPNNEPPKRDIPPPTSENDYYDQGMPINDDFNDYIDTSDLANQGVDYVNAGDTQAYIDGNGHIAPVDPNSNVVDINDYRQNPRPDTQPIDPNFSATNQPEGYGYEEGALPRPRLDPSDPNYQPANQSNNTQGFDSNEPTAEQRQEASRYIDDYDAQRQNDVTFETDEFGQTTGVSNDPIIIEASMEERMQHAESAVDKTSRLNTVVDRIEFLETLRASVGMKNASHVHQNMLNPDAYEQVMKIDDAILAMPDDKLFDKEHKKVALKFLDGLAQELKNNPNGTLETSIVSENVMSHDEFEHPDTQEAALGYAILTGDDMDAVVASVFTMQQKADGNYPFLIDAAGRQPISPVFDLRSLDDFTQRQASSPKALSAYLEVKFARENYNSLSDNYKNGITKEQLDIQFSKFENLGMIGNIRATNRNLDKNPAAEHLFLLDGIQVSEPVAFDEIRDFVSTSASGTGAFGQTSTNPQMLKDKIANTNSVLNYQIANLSYLPEHLAIPEGVRQLANVTNVANKTFDVNDIEKQNRAIRRHGLKSDEWQIASDKDAMNKLLEKDPAAYTKLTESLAFSIKNYHQLGNFSDKQNEHGSTSGFPIQAEMRNALSTMESLNSKEVLESAVPVLAKINPEPSDANNALLFTNKDAQAIYNKMDADLERSDLTTQDVDRNTATQKDLAGRGFVKGSEFTLVDTPNIEGFGAAQGRALLSSYLNNLDSHRDFTTDGLASSIGAGVGALPTTPSEGAFGNAVSSISQALVDTNNGDVHPKKIGMVLDSILSEPDFERSARPVDLGDINPAAAPLPEASTDPQPVADITPAADATPSAENSESSAENSDDKPKEDGKKGQRSESEKEYDEQEQKKKAAQNAQNNGGSNYTVTGFGALVHSLGRAFSKNPDGAANQAASNYPMLSGVTDNASNAATDGSEPSASSKAKHPRLPANVHRNLTKMHESAIKFEIAAKALEVNKQHNMLSPKDIKTVEKDIKKHFDAYNESALMASESLDSMAPSLSNKVRGNVANQMTTVQKKMNESVTEATKKNVFSLNPNQKKIADEADSSITKAVSGLKNFFTAKLTSLFSRGPR